MLTIHSEKQLHLTVKDALKDNMDFVANKLLIRKFGKNIDENSDGKEDVQGFYYFNEYFN